jgi:hypothetical protein
MGLFLLFYELGFINHGNGSHRALLRAYFASLAVFIVNGRRYGSGNDTVRAEKPAGKAGGLVPFYRNTFIQINHRAFDPPGTGAAAVSGAGFTVGLMATEFVLFHL